MTKLPFLFNEIKKEIFYGDNLEILKEYIPDGYIDLIYIDPPFNSGKIQERQTIKVKQSSSGDRIGFSQRKYKIIKKEKSISYSDIFESSKDYFNFIEPRLQELHRVLKPQGSFFLHLDYREVHLCKLLLDQIFGRNNFKNEIIWAYDYGGRSKKKWSTKHDNILWYTKNSKEYTFNFDEMDRIPYMSPGLVGKEKATKGKTPTDVWWHTIVPTQGKEKTGYPTQKPLGILERIIKIHSNKNDITLDCFAGSGSFGEAALKNNRKCILIDNNEEAINIIKNRLKDY